MTRLHPAIVRDRPHLSLRTRSALFWAARRDGVRNVPFVAALSEAGSVSAFTPRLGIVQAEAEDAAREEWRALHELTRENRLAHDDATVALHSTRTKIADLTGRGIDPNSSSLDAEELRRLLREEDALHRIIASHEAAIEEHVGATRQAIEQIYVHANLLARTYWQALRRHHRVRTALSAEPRLLTVPDWVDAGTVVPSPRATQSSTPVDLTERKRRAKN